MSGMGQVWRHVRTDRSIANSKLDRGTVKRVLSFARPHRRLITVFLALTVVDACLVVVSPLLVKHIVDNGILAKTLPVVKRVMEDAPMPALSLSVPLQVDARAAHNWDEAH